MQVNTGDFKLANFDQWNATLRSIYRQKNISKKRTPSDMWLRAVSDASRVVENIRKERPAIAMNYLVRTMSWVMTTTDILLTNDAYKINWLSTYDEKNFSSLSQIILHKYPNLCPYCNEKSCVCMIRRKKDDKDGKSDWKLIAFEAWQQRIINNHFPTSISEMAEMFQNIYGMAHHVTSIQEIAAHFNEEVGEVALCIVNLQEGKKTLKNEKDKTPLAQQLAGELADVVAWSFGVVNKLTSSANRSIELLNLLNLGYAPRYPTNVTINQAEGVDEREKENTPLTANIYNQLNKTLLAEWLWHVYYNSEKNDFVCHECTYIPCACGN